MKYNFFNQKAEPKNVQAIEKMVGHELESTKDPNNYNFDLFSRSRDKVAGMLCESGIEKIMNKDVIEITSLGRVHNFKRMDIFDLDLAVSQGDYYFYPYNIVVENELRTKYLLQTEADDNIQDMSEELFIILKKYMNEDDISKIKSALEKSKERIYNQKINFLDPYPGLEEGNYRKLNKEEKEKNLIISEDDILVDERTERLDLLSLKELLLILKHEKEVDKYSIGMGFFNKFMPELNKEGIQGLVLEVENKKVKSLKIGKLETKVDPSYSPLRALLLGLENSIFEKHLEKYEFKTKTVYDLELNKKRDFSEDYFIQVSVDGMIANQEDVYLTGYSGTSLNNRTEKAGETFLIDNEKMIRLYFVPYSYENFPLIHNHGSVIFGSNDQTFHSCFEREQKNISEFMIADLQEWWNKKTETFDLPEMYSPAVLSLMFHAKDEDPINFFKRREDVYSAMRSLSEESFVTRLVAFNLFFAGSMNYSIEELRKVVWKYLVKQHPLSKSFNLKKYVEENELSELQETWIYKQCKELYIKDNIASLAHLPDDEEEEETENK